MHLLRRTDRAALALAVFLSIFILEACAKRDPQASRGPHELNVYAIPPLTEAYTALAHDFERMYPTTRVVFKFAGPPDLESDIDADCKADVLASTSMKLAGRLIKEGTIREPIVFAWNRAAIVVAAETESIRKFEDLPLARRIAVAGPDFPIGEYAGRILEAARAYYGSDFRDRVEARIINREGHERTVLDKVVRGEADAGIVFRSAEFAGAKGVRFIPIPVEVDVVSKFTAAIVRCSPDTSLARDWLDYLKTDEAKRTLNRFGFITERPLADGSL